MVWWTLFLLLLTTSASICLQHSRNLAKYYFSAQYRLITPNKDRIKTQHGTGHSFLGLWPKNEWLLRGICIINRSPSPFSFCSFHKEILPPSPSPLKVGGETVCLEQPPLPHLSPFIFYHISPALRFTTLETCTDWIFHQQSNFIIFGEVSLWTCNSAGSQRVDRTWERE